MTAPSGRSSIGQTMRPLGAAVEPLGMQDHVHLGGARALGSLRARRQCFGEGLGILAPALETGPVPGRERGHLVEEEQLGVALPRPARAGP